MTNGKKGESKEGEKTEEEKREDVRQLALRNLTAPSLTNLALAYLTSKNKDFGEADNSAVHDFKYLPSYKGATFYNEDGKEVNLFDSILMGSRQGEERYTGRVDEYGLIQTSASIIQRSLSYLRVNDIFKLMGSNATIDKKYDNKYISDIIPKIDEKEFTKLSDKQKEEIKKDQEFVQALIGGYMNYFTKTGVASALNQSAIKIRSGLEELVKPEEKPQK